MHIAFFDFVTQYGGAPRIMIGLAGRLAEHTRVSVIDPYGYCPEYREAAARTKVDYHVLDATAGRVVVGGRGLGRARRVVQSAGGLWRIRARLVRLLRSIEASVLCCYSHKAMYMAGASLSLRKLALVAYMQGWCVPELVPKYVRRIYRSRCDALFALSEPTGAALRCLGVPSEKITVLHHPFDMDSWLTRAEQPLAAELPQLERPVRLLLPALLLRTKGQHTAISALKEIVDKGVDAVLWLAGDLGVGGDQGYVDSTRQLAAELGVTDRVEWLGLRPDMPQLMKAATMVVLPSHTEGFGLVVAEAMALGKPVAATPVGGILDLILPGVTGLCFEVEDHAGLAECVLEVINDPRAASCVCARAQEYIRTSPRFRAEQQTERALAVFRRLSGEDR